MCPTASVSPDTACLINEIAALRSEVRATRAEMRATALESRGLALVSRLNQLQAEEMMFRQQISTNPNTPNAQMMAMTLQSQADALYRDISAFNSELGTIPQDQRPYLAARLNNFQQIYWNPAMQQFATYRSQFPQASTTYQAAYTANPWLQTWQANYSASLNNISNVPQIYASANWWSNMQVLGTTETLPSGGSVVVGPAMNLPTGAVIYIPAGASMSMSPTPMMYQPMPAR